MPEAWLLTKQRGVFSSCSQRFKDMALVDISLRDSIAKVMPVRGSDHVVVILANEARR